MRRQIERQLGPVDILVANAGDNYAIPGPLESIDEEGWRLSIDGNLTATLLSLKSFLPGMKERRRGSIVTISSAAARRAHPATPIPYAAAKAGIIMMTQHLRPRSALSIFASTASLLKLSSQKTTESVYPKRSWRRLPKLTRYEDLARLKMWLGSSTSGALLISLLQSHLPPLTTQHRTWGLPTGYRPSGFRRCL